MNNKRRNQIAQAKHFIQQGIILLNKVKEEEENAFDNLSEGLQQTMRGEQMEENANILDETIDAINEAIDSLDEIF